MRNRDEVLYAFRPVGKLSEAQSMRVMKLQTSFEELACEILEMAPECADRTSALRKLHECKMTCTQAISHYYGAAKPEEKTSGKKGKDTASAESSK